MLQVFLQKAEKEQIQSWRPSVVAISDASFQRLDAFLLLSWIAHRHGFGTYIHTIKGYLSKETSVEAKDCYDRLVEMAEANRSNIYIDTLVSPSFTSTIAQVIQLPGISGKENNLLLFEYHRNNPDKLNDILDNFTLIRAVDFDLIILSSSERGFGLKKHIHIWITQNDLHNATLMIPLAYILLGHRDWKHADIEVFALFSEEKLEVEKARFLAKVEAGRLPISPSNVTFMVQEKGKSQKEIIRTTSSGNDLTILGFREELVKHMGREIFDGYEGIGNMLFVNAGGK